MNRDNDSGYRKFKKWLILIGMITALALFHLAINVLIPFIRQMHGF